MITTDRELQIAIGKGVPPAGSIVKGGIVISLASNNEFENLYTSTNGQDIVRLRTIAKDSEKLGGSTKAQLQTAIINAITNGASGAYNTLKELETELKSNDSQISTLITNVGKKVDKVSGKSLILNTLITKISNLPIFSKLATANSLVQRSGYDVVSRLFRTEYTSLNTKPNYFVTMVETGKNKNNYMRPTSVDEVRKKLGVSQGAESNTKIMEY